MTMTGYPWSVLELEPGADMSAIRRAYAKKLKTIRPDEDPTGFQTLVEARDRALVLAETAQHRTKHDEFAPVEPLPYPTAILAASTPDRPPVTAKILPPPLDERTDDIEAEQALPGGPSSTVDLAALKTQLGKLHNMSSVYVDLDGWNNFLLRIGELPTQMRELLEPAIIESFCNITQYCERTSWFPHVPVHRRDRELILAYDEEFGWSANDRKVYAVIGREWADGFKWRLSQIWAEQRPQHELGKRGLARRAEQLARRAEQAAAIRKAAPPKGEFNFRPFMPFIALLAMYLIQKLG
ncbi:hypothetical protein QA648_29740 (plasmid) [Rhizobium sp. CB3171]|uniref:hypothetical protein n=1 Tax=Rhizobium sp. CB3171 TaxID=3039157 RepID=UPI0024B13245|nr:hypothetical protein [Rhizobium sp. CB3171]WFU04933.1 hypothetical protein QA648_29740 [Rhizobium sp. CB3171]